MSRFRRFAALALVAVLVVPAQAAKPGRWREVGRSKIPWTYWQGMTHDEYGFRYFSGMHVGIWKTTRNLKEIAGKADIIPPEVHLTENYNHIGDISYYKGKLYLPLECYYFQAGNTCGNGAIGVVDADDLTWEYYVKLSTDDDMHKAMWNEVSPDGRFLWTSGGDKLQHLFVYSMNDISRANAAPDGRVIRPVRILQNAVPPSGITGATFIGDRLFLAGGNEQQIWSVDTATGERRLEVDIEYIGEAEGLDDDFDLAARHDGLKGDLHWQVMPYNTEWYPTNGLDGVIYHFEATPPKRLKPRLCKKHPHGKHKKHCRGKG